MQHVQIEPTFDSWRDRSRALLRSKVPPEQVLWVDQHQNELTFDAHYDLLENAHTMPKVPQEFIDLARNVAAHDHPQRWALLYQLVWRITHGGEAHLLAMATDSQVRRAHHWRKEVSRSIHKMHAFVRFRAVDVDAVSQRECYVAWFEPPYRIVRLAAPFFQKRFTQMNWSILTPDECVHWDGEHLKFTAGVARDAAPTADAMDEYWRTYYRSIFNPARVKIQAMQAEMPKMYWHNLPEAEIIQSLVQESSQRVGQMMATDERPTLPAPKNAYLEKLRTLGDVCSRNDARREETEPTSETMRSLQTHDGVEEKMAERLE